MKNKDEVIFGSIEEKEATERVLATLRIKKINQDLDDLKTEVYKYAENIDKVAKKSSMNTNYLENVKANLDEITLDDQFKNVDFRIKEVAEDFIKRINTRIIIIKNSELLIEELKNSYHVKEVNLKEDIKIAKLDRSDFELRLED